jgi:hypothetical protein
MGPTRVLTAERWLDSIAQVAFGQAQGVCDYRFVSQNYNWRRMVDPRMITPPMPGARYSDQYHDWAESLGGCTAQARAVGSSLSLVSAQGYLARKFCANGPMVLPPGFNEGDTSPGMLDQATNWLYQRALGRSPSDDELGAARDDMTQCINAGPDAACADAGVAARWFCTRLLDSAEFGIF